MKEFLCENHMKTVRRTKNDNETYFKKVNSLQFTFNFISLFLFFNRFVWPFKIANSERKNNHKIKLTIYEQKK